MGNKVRDPGMVKRSDPSFPCASLDVGLGLRLAYAVDQEHKNSFSSSAFTLAYHCSRKAFWLLVNELRKPSIESLAVDGVDLNATTVTVTLSTTCRCGLVLSNR
jgi:hypothetical protein